MDNWESDDFEVTMPTASKADKWEGEDEDDDVKDSWDDPEEEKKEEEKPQQTANTTKKTKKQLEKKIEEKERKLKESMTKKPSEMTPEELLAEKIRRKELQEEADLMLAKQLLGADSPVLSLESQEEFDKFKDDILSKLVDSTKKDYFPTFVELLVQGLCVHLPSADIKKLAAWLSNLHIEKSKLEKGDKAKKNKGKGKAKLKLEGDTDYNEFSAYTEDYDDFM